MKLNNLAERKPTRIGNSIIERGSAKQLWAAMVFCVSLSGCATLFHHPSQDEASIRELRSVINRAFAAQDTASLRFIYEPDYNRSTELAIPISSADSNFRIWGDNFERDPIFRVTWHPQRIAFRNYHSNVAVETGTYDEASCEYDVLVHSTGRYLAQWKNTGTRWRLVHEAQGTYRLSVGKPGSCHMRPSK